ncbi:MAG: hypothetical protein WC526_01045 [Patescibacteria group bacterium]
MIETSKDILYLVIAFCVLWLTVFLCWTFFYVVKILKNTNRVVEEFRSRLQLLTETINYVRGKVESIHALIGLAGGNVANAVKNIVSKKAKEWVDSGSKKMNTSAKDAVDFAVKATAKGMSKVAKKIRR